MRGWMSPAFLVSLALVVAGCARPVPVPTPTPTPGVALPAPIAAPTPTPPPTPLPVAKPIGELRIALGWLGTEVGDPTLGAALGVKPFSPNFDMLVGGNPETGEFSKERGLARDWEVSHGPASSTYTLYLRQGVRFHNGEEVTAEDVRFSLEYFMRPRSVSSAAGTLRANISKVEVVDRYTVRVTTKKLYPLLLIDLSPLGFSEGIVMPKKYVQEKGEDAFNLTPIGSGPYIFKERVFGSYVRYEALDQHWLVGVPRFKTLTLYLVPEETTRIAMLKLGQADLIEVSRERAKELAGFNLFLKPGSEVVFVYMHNQFQPDTYLYDQRVREALNLAINREEIRDFIFVGQATVVGNALYGSYSLNYKPLPLYPYDPEKAKRLLTEAFPKGVALTMNSFPLSGVPELMRMNEAVAGFWGKVGVKTKIVPMDYGAHRVKRAAKELPNITSGFTAPNRPFWTSVWRVVHHSQGAFSESKDPKLDALMEAAEAEADLTKIAQREWETARYMRENHLVVSVVETGMLFAGNPKKAPEWNLGKHPYDFNLLDLVRRR